MMLQAGDVIYDQDLWLQVWDKQLIPNISFFWWTLSHGKLLNQDKLQHRGFIGPNICTLCKKENETNTHIFVKCDFIRKCWHKLTQALNYKWEEGSTIQETITSQGNRSKRKKERKLRIIVQAYLQWQIWKEENNKLFEGKESEATKVLIMDIIREIENVKNSSTKTMENNDLIFKILSILQSLLVLGPPLSRTLFYILVCPFLVNLYIDLWVFL